MFALPFFIVLLHAVGLGLLLGRALRLGSNSLLGVASQGATGLGAFAAEIWACGHLHLLTQTTFFGFQWLGGRGW